MVHYLTHWVREKKVLRLEEAVRKMTSMPATRFGLKDRGLLHSGAFADVVVFDFNALDNKSTLENPLQYCRGVNFVIVNGQLVIDTGKHTGARPGRNISYH
jgi:N-acyl-D-amino-acid deacylase